MTDRPPPDELDAAFWYDFLTRGDPKERRARSVFRRIPRGPRCKLCAAPFEGAGGQVMRMIGKRRSEQSPSMCSTCFDFMLTHHGGAEIEVTLLFADIRGSTAIAETVTATAFRALLDRFYAAASAAVFDNDGSIDKFVGDEIMALFFPLLAGHEHASRAVDAARAVLVATGHGNPGGPWLPIGAGVHTGVAWVGSIGDEAHAELTAVGDVVNTAARIAAAASAGEILVSSDAATAARLDGGLERRTLELKGKQAATEAVVVHV